MSSLSTPKESIFIYRRRRFKEMWPAALAKLEQISGTKAPANAHSHPLAFMHMRTVLEMNEDAAHDLADGKLDDVAKDERAIKEFLDNGDHDLDHEQLVNAARVLQPFAAILGYGSKKSE